MNAYLWTSAAPVSDAYHDGGAVLIIAASLDSARQAWSATQPDGWAEAIEDDPDRTWPLDGSPAPEVLVFPDAGCC